MYLHNVLEAHLRTVKARNQVDNVKAEVTKLLFENRTHQHDERLQRIGHANMILVLQHETQRHAAAGSVSELQFKTRTTMAMVTVVVHGGVRTCLRMRMRTLGVRRGGGGGKNTPTAR